MVPFWDTLWDPEYKPQKGTTLEPMGTARCFSRVGCLAPGALQFRVVSGQGQFASDTPETPQRDPMVTKLLNSKSPYLI